jgi:hypothetical protein
MKVQSVTSPHVIPVNGTPESVRTAKAVAAFNAGKSSYDTAAAPNHSINPNNISLEELSAVKPVSNPSEILQNSQTVDTAPATEPEPKPEVKEDPALQRQFAQLARQERQLRAKAQQQDQAIKAREQALQAKEDAIRTKEQEYSQGYISKDQLKRDTMRILADAGVSYDELTQQILNQPGIDPRTEAVISKLEAKIAALEDKATQGVKAQEESQQQAYKAAVKQIELDVRSTVANDPNFETIKATHSVSDVVQLIEETYKKDGYVMSVDEACNEVENYLVEEAMKVTRIGKIKRQLEQAGMPKPSPKTAETQQQTQQTPKTLTNAIGSTRKLSNRERAIAAMEGRLKG